MTLCDEVEKYISAAKGQTFFYVVGDNQYLKILDEFKQRGFQVDRTSRFCSKEDKVPSIDDIIDYFRTLDIDYKQNQHVLVGLGEFLALRGAVIAEKELRRLRATTLGGARVVLLLRCVSPQMRELAEEDNHKLVKQKRVYFEDNLNSELSVLCTDFPIFTDVAQGIKGLLEIFEDGACDTCSVKTALDFSHSLIPISWIHSAYDAINRSYPNLNMKEAWGSEQQWEQLLQMLSSYDGNLDALFEEQGFSDRYEENLYNNCIGLEFKNWLFFLYLQKNIDNIPDIYLQRVLSATDCYEDLKTNILIEIINIPRSDRNFMEYYYARKKLIQNFPETDIAIFIHENSANPKESIYRFTDNTEKERKEIIKWCSIYGLIPEIDYIYPALNQYLSEYKFNCGDFSDQLTAYFQDYKRQKIANRIEAEFMDRVIENAKTLPYTHLETRDSVILGIEDKKSVFLYWIDALGVEYLAYISALAYQKELSMHVDIAYTTLPTITSFNHSFYEEWRGAKKEKDSRLDEIKHKDKGGYVFDENHEAPVHLAAELKVIEDAVNRAATELAMHTCKSFVIASDHGASRLAVIRRQEEKYETDTKGEHSGRCCREFPDADLPYAVNDNGYYVLADYGRFQKSRAANVEVHGGATLEEVVVPIITLTLRKQNESEIKIVNENEIYADRKKGTTIMLYISGIEHPDKVSAIIDSERYVAVRQDSTHFNVEFLEQRRSKKNVSADIYDGEDLIGTIVFDIKGKFDSAEKNEFSNLDF